MRQMRLCLALAVAVLACAAVPAEAQYPVSGWSRVYEAVEHATGYATSPRLMRAFALRVSLRNPDVGIFVSPGNGGASYEVALQTTPAFLPTYGMRAGVNACYFDPGLSPNMNIEGLLVSNGSGLASRPAAVSRDANSACVFVRGDGDHLYEQF